ncbi:MAG: hypothetical protein KUG79_08690 [Pseudomonadales bacterium]|nr:hypothetical protein [Pseudomonadales bacterium]
MKKSAKVSVFTNGADSATTKLNFREIYFHQVASPTDIDFENFTEVNFLLDTVDWTEDKSIKAEFQQVVSRAKDRSIGYWWQIKTQRALQMYSHMIQEIGDLLHGCPYVDDVDIRSVMAYMDQPSVGIGRAVGGNRASRAVQNAINDCPADFLRLKGLLITVRAEAVISLSEFTSIAKYADRQVGSDASIVLATIVDSSVGDRLIVSVMG